MINNASIHEAFNNIVDSNFLCLPIRCWFNMLCWGNKLFCLVQSVLEVFKQRLHVSIHFCLNSSPKNEHGVGACNELGGAICNSIQAQRVTKTTPNNVSE